MALCKQWYSHQGHGNTKAGSVVNQSYTAASAGYNLVLVHHICHFEYDISDRQHGFFSTLKAFMAFSHLICIVVQLGILMLQEHNVLCSGFSFVTATISSAGR